MLTPPLDIIESIVDILAASDLQSIRTISLTCHAFLPICRKRLFSSVSLMNRDIYFQMPRPPMATTSMLHNLLTGSPDISRYIRDLTFVMQDEDASDPTVVAVFQRLIHLRSLVIHYYPFIYNINPEVSWSSNPLRSVLRHLLEHPSLTELRICANHDILLADLTSCISLENLTLEIFASTEISEIPLQLPVAPIRLRSFKFGSPSAPGMLHLYGTNCTDGRPFLDFSKLTRLSVALTEVSHLKDSQTGLLISLCKSLSTVKITVDEEATDVKLTSLSGVIRPSRNTLKDLHISIYLVEVNIPPEDTLTALVDELDQIGENDNVLEGITLRVDIVETFNIHEEKWRKLDRLFARHRWPKLRRVSLTICAVVGLLPTSR
ncbi:hypothetical protein BDN70DRAFT_995212 [Pholiota conissans]|uniref:F-box domain-containing protein n=1 Tax=Pholiota conissans TaxID=109636 RepID=A0A9P5YWM1_9AGAR|nr:hypothetical protein BDN70DRAFT_995212 [Pholiota conissans]